MAKKRNQNRRRVTPANATRSVPRGIANTRPRPVAYTQLRAIEDRRRWHPDGPSRPAKRLSGANHRLVALDSSKPQKSTRYALNPVSEIQLLNSVPARVAFEAPKSVAICVRRSIRKQVMFAKNKTGKTGQKKPRLTEYSSVSCKRSKK